MTEQPQQQGYCSAAVSSAPSSISCHNHKDWQNDRPEPSGHSSYLSVDYAQTHIYLLFSYD